VLAYFVVAPRTIKRVRSLLLSTARARSGRT
jgi:hypothetical protein